MPSSNNNFINLAELLLHEWEKRGNVSDSLLPSHDLASALDRMISVGLLAPNAVTLGAAGIEIAETAIKNFQDGKGVPVDGVLGKTTFSKVMNFVVCKDPTESTTPLPPAAKAKGDPASGLLHYFVEPELLNKQIGSTTGKMLIGQAVFNWLLDVDLRVHRTADINEANIVMSLVNGDGRGGILANADIGGPNVTDRQLGLRFDRNEDWTEEQFRNTAAHELGHILGLRHENAPADQLMCGTQHIEVQKPTPNDIARLQRIWGVFQS